MKGTLVLARAKASKVMVGKHVICKFRDDHYISGTVSKVEQPGMDGGQVYFKDDKSAVGYQCSKQGVFVPLIEDVSRDKAFVVNVDQWMLLATQIQKVKDSEVNYFESVHSKEGRSVYIARASLM